MLPGKPSVEELLPEKPSFQNDVIYSAPNGQEIKRHVGVSAMQFDELGAGNLDGGEGYWRAEILEAKPGESEQRCISSGILFPVNVDRAGKMAHGAFEHLQIAAKSLTSEQLRKYIHQIGTLRQALKTLDYINQLKALGII